MQLEAAGRHVDLWPRADSADASVVHEVWELRTYQWEPADVHRRAVLDLGANIGAFALWAAACGAERVRAVEAAPDNFTRLALHVARNPLLAGRVEAVHAAAGPFPAYRVTETAAGADSWADPTQDAPGVVPGRPLRSLLDELGDDVLVKCDIEGGEYELFRAADDDDLARIDRLVMEWHTPGVPGGLGSRPTPEPCRWPVGELIRRLTMHHRVTVEGEPTLGGLLWADRY